MVAALLGTSYALWAAACYVATELAKEAPCHAGAYGATMLSETVDSTDALSFLTGVP